MKAALVVLVSVVLVCFRIRAASQATPSQGGESCLLGRPVCRVLADLTDQVELVTREVERRTTHIGRLTDQVELVTREVEQRTTHIGRLTDQVELVTREGEQRTTHIGRLTDQVELVTREVERRTTYIGRLADLEERLAVHEKRHLHTTASEGGVPGEGGLKEAHQEIRQLRERLDSQESLYKDLLKAVEEIKKNEILPFVSNAEDNVLGNSNSDDGLSLLLTKVERVENITSEVQEELESEKRVRRHLEEDLNATRHDVRLLNDKFEMVAIVNRTLFEDRNETRESDEDKVRSLHFEEELEYLRAILTDLKENSTDAMTLGASRVNDLEERVTELTNASKWMDATMRRGMQNIQMQIDALAQVQLDERLTQSKIRNLTFEVLYRRVALISENLAIAEHRVDSLETATRHKLKGCEETPCENTTFGCCSGGLTAASGPDYEGCDNATKAFPIDIEGSLENCYDLRFGCCPDGKTPAEGPNQTGCEDAENITDCKTSAFGCCEDGITFPEGPFKMGCPDLESSGDGEFLVPCNESTFGCCPDDITLAKGFEEEGCFPANCSDSTYDCCSDNVTSASGPNEEGCYPEDCSNSTFGCCPDNITAALGFVNEGCFQEDCSNSTFGCCQDNVTEAKGPDGEGCEPINCSNTTFGCCPDNSMIAKGPDYQGCIYEDCANTTYGCCSDNKTVSGPSFEGCDDTKTAVDCGNTTLGCCMDNTTAASGLYFEGCENATDCSSTEFGCCPDNITVAMGMDLEGCNKTDTTTEPLTTTVPPDCVGSTFGCCPDEVTVALGRNLEGCCFGVRFGCCPDNKTAALGPTFLGCGCHTYPYGCCPDGKTPSKGFNYHGCKCEYFRYGCCQDKFTPATGPNFEGCVCQLMQYGCCLDGITPRTSENDDGCGCESTRFGCCPDGRTPAQGTDMSGCTCDSLPYGCCPNGFTPARTPDLRDCPCETQRYGCCLDGRTDAKGPNYEGCPCESTRFGCCPDGRTVAQGPNMYGCPCETLPYGCCADGYTPAQGQRYEGCPDVRQPKPEVSTEVCSFPKDSGPCRNFTVKWFFDIPFGGCSRFWYGGCDGNGNKFDTTEDCENVCVKPEGPKACFLPKTIGSCNDKIPSWYYDVGSESCEAFTYGGCLGNNNRFVTKEACEQKCINLQPNVCSLPMVKGSCIGTFTQWYYDKDLEDCLEFVFTGCQGNANRFKSKESCYQRCRKEKLVTTQAPVVSVDDLVPATQPEPARILPGPSVIGGKIGEPAELPCNATGWPKPTVTWRRELRQTIMLPLASQRYEQLPNYALLIRSVVHEDAGVYSCEAHNGIGAGSIFNVRLFIQRFTT